MMTTRVLAPLILCALLGLSIFMARLHYDNLALTANEALESIRRPFTKPTISGRLQGPLDPAVYTIFEQVYAQAEPPALRLDGIAKVWAESEYRSDVYLRCYLPTGGMATLFSHLKACISLALGLGTNLVIPTTPSRNHEVLNEWDKKEVPIGKWLDRDFFIARLQAACPQIKVALLDDQKRPILDVAKTVSLDPCMDADHSKLKFCTDFGPYAADDVNKPWRVRTTQRLDEILEARTHEERQGNMILDMIGYGGFFNKSANLQTAARFVELTELFRTPAQIRKLLATLIDATSVAPGQLKPFYGVHFRVEQDAMDEIKNGWHTPEEQLERVLAVSEQANIAFGTATRIIYLACGEQDKVDLFRETAGARGWTVIDKWTIAQDIGPDFVSQLNALDFDHMAMIDSAFLLISDFFVGTGDSAFSWNVAHLRNPTGRYWGDTLEPDAFEPGHRQDNLLARTHLFNAGESLNGYHCCG